MTAAFMDMATPVVEFARAITSKPPTRRQRFMRKARKYGPIALALAGLGIGGARIFLVDSDKTPISH